MEGLNTILMEALKVGGPVALLIVLGYFERKSILDRHYEAMKLYNEALEKHGDAIKELVIIIRERLK
jgi:hypothetical protein